MANWQRIFVAAASSLILITALISRLSYTNFINDNILLCLVQVLVALLCLASSVAAVHIASLNPASSFSLHSLLSSYRNKYIVIPILGKWKYNQMLSIMEDPQSHQDKLLMNILKENGQTIFAKDHGLDKVKTPAEFRNKFPLTDYTAYEKYVERIGQGEENIMTRAEVKYIILSSGTTGKNKMFPYTFYDGRTLQLSFLITYYIYMKLFNPRLGRYFMFSLFHPVRKSACGTTMGGIGMVLSKKQPENILPDCIRKITKEGPIYFIQALFALLDPDITLMIGYSSDLMYAFFKSMELNKEKLCRAIKTGHIESFPYLDEDVRAELNQLLTPDSDRAKQVHRQLTRGSDGLAARLWPDLSFALMAKTGGFAHSAELMKQSYMKNITVGYGIHLATEGFIGMSMSANDVLNELYTLIPTLAFIEFIKIEDTDKKNPSTYLMSQLEVGQLYELVVTTYQGLYRNRFGDVIKVVGFTGNTPKYTFQYRIGQILNCAYDRTPEKVFYEAVRITEAQWQGVTIRNYTSTESMYIEVITGQKYEKNHYVAFVETEEPISLTQEQCDMLEINLCNIQEAYAEYRNQDSVGPLSIIQVKSGTFDNFREVMWGKNPSPQFKTPRVLHRHDALTFLWNNRLSQKNTSQASEVV